MNTEKLLKELTQETGVTGSETELAKKLAKMLEKYCDESYINKFNSCIGIKRSDKTDAKTIMLEAHLDQIGMMVKGIDDNGFVKFVSLGGIDPRILPAAEVYILGKETVYGVIGAKPPHLMNKEDEEKSAKINDMLIDTGFKGEELKKKISVGDSIVFKSEFNTMLGGSAISKAMDNRAGIASIFLCLESMKNKTANYNLIVLFSSEEEMGLYGAYTAEYDNLPDLSITIDVTHGMTPDAKNSEGVFPLGSGAIICRGPNLNSVYTNKIINLAKSENISYDIEAAAGSTGTTATAIQTIKIGIPTALISIPLKYMHTTVETLCIKDIEYVAELLSKILEGGVLNA